MTGDAYGENRCDRESEGGVGKTTSCVNLAAALKAAGQRILLCDFDPQANAHLRYGRGQDRIQRHL